MRGEGLFGLFAVVNTCCIRFVFARMPIVVVADHKICCEMFALSFSASFDIANSQIHTHTIAYKKLYCTAVSFLDYVLT